MIRKLFVLFLVALVIAGLAYWFSTHNENKEISIFFNRADGITEGSKLVLNGATVGEVKELRITDSKKVVAESVIYEEYKDKVNSSSVFIVESGGGTQNLDKRQITVEILDKNAPPFPEGTKVIGYSSRGEFLLLNIEKALEGGYKEFGNRLDEFHRGIEEFKRSEEVRRLKEQMQRLKEEARRIAEIGIQELREEIPRLRAELDEIIEELKKLGRDKEAEEFEEEFDRYLEKLKSETREVKSAPETDIKNASAKAAFCQNV